MKKYQKIIVPNQYSLKKGISKFRFWWLWSNSPFLKILLFGAQHVINNGLTHFSMKFSCDNETQLNFHVWSPIFAYFNFYFYLLVVKHPVIDVPLRLFFWGKKSCATALFDGGTFNENLMVLLRTVLALKDILFIIQF